LTHRLVAGRIEAVVPPEAEMLVAALWHRGEDLLADGLRWAPSRMRFEIRV
jgi:hypothetical protein